MHALKTGRPPGGMHTPLEQHIQLAQGGDPAALVAVLRHAQPDAKRYARRYCLASDVDDAVQESLIRLAQRLPQLRVAAALTGWVLTTVKRECLRLARVVWRHDALDEELLARVANRPEEGLRIDLSRALESLPAHYRLSPPEAQAFLKLKAVSERSDGVIPAKYRELIALGVALTTQCAYCIDAHLDQALRAGVSKEELAEAVFITAALRAGAAVGHGLMASRLYDEKRASQTP